MPRQTNITEIRLNNIIACLTPIVSLLDDLHDGFGTPFVPAISSTTLSLISAVQTVKRNKDECIQFMEDIYKLLCAIINLHLMSETGGALSPQTLHHIGEFTETLHKIHTFVEAQVDGNKIKHFFRHSEMTSLLNDCRTRLQHTLEVFKIEGGLVSFTDIDEAQKKAQSMHRDLLELITSHSDGSSVDTSSLMYQTVTGSQNSSNSFSLLPAKPKIFHGREAELRDIVKSLTQEPARIAILGAGGMGKTNLAKAALHHPEIIAKYEDRFFVLADSATTSIELAAVIGLQLGLKPGKDLTKLVVQYFTKEPRSLLVLDNLDTIWEPVQSRAGITMRGAERPAKVRWTRPFLAPLDPLSDEAALQTFIDIADDSHDAGEINQLLRLTDNMPLAVDLIAHLVDYEGCANILARWETEKTRLLSEGSDKRSNLDASITISLSSPRMGSVPGAQELLSLLSILPDGLSDVELMQSCLPIRDVLACKAMLLGTSLAYQDDKKRLKLLLPIREHIQHFYPPSRSLVQALRKHFHLLLDLYQKYRGLHQTNGNINEITANLGNLQQLLRLELYPDNSDFVDCINCTIALNAFSRTTGHGRTLLMDHILAVLPQICDHRLNVCFIIEALNTRNHFPIVTAPLLIDQAIKHFHNLDDPVLESKFYMEVGTYHAYSQTDLPMAMQFFEKALVLSRLTGDSLQQSTLLEKFAAVSWMRSEYNTGQTYAIEAQKLARLSVNLYDEASALRTQALCCSELGDYITSSSLFHRARELLNLCGLSGCSLDHTIRSTQAQAHLMKSEYTEAASIHAQVFKDSFVEQDPYKCAMTLISISEIDVITRPTEDGVYEKLEKARGIMSTLGYHAGLLYCDMISADLNLSRRNIPTAKALFQQCLDRSWGKDVETMIYCLERVADVSQWRLSEFQWASTWSVVYFAFAQRSHGKLSLNKALRCLGDVFLAQGDANTTASLFTLALEGFTYMDIHRSRAECMLRLGDIASKRGNFETAVQLWTDARPLFERTLQARDAAKVDTRLAAVHQDILEKHEEAIGHLSQLDVPTILAAGKSQLEPDAEQALVLTGKKLPAELASA